MVATFLWTRKLLKSDSAITRKKKDFLRVFFIVGLAGSSDNQAVKNSPRYL